MILAYFYCFSQLWLDLVNKEQAILQTAVQILVSKWCLKPRSHAGLRVLGFANGEQISVSPSRKYGR